MKSINGFVITTYILLGIFTFGCRKAEPERKIPIYFPGDMQYGKVTALRGEDQWVASARAGYNKENPDYFYFNSGTIDEYGLTSEVLDMEYIPLVLGKYLVKYKSDPNILDGIVTSAYAFGEDDITDGLYKPDTTASGNYIELTDYNDSTKIVKGRFDVHYIVADPVYDWGPERIHFSNGTFEIQLVQ